jgi:transmembrane 9 superfamily protein 2/4
VYRYNEVLTDEERALQQQELREESGWKLVYGDVFRPPPLAGLLAVYTGTGVQLLLMAVLTLACSCLGFLSPSNRGSLLNAFLIFFFLSGASAGYVAARFCTIFREESKLKITMLTALSFQGVCAIIFFVLNVVIWAEGSSGAVPFGTFIAVLALSFFISVPLTFVGAYLGFRTEPISLPTRTNAIPRQIPPQKWYMNRWISAIVGGLLPFGAVFVELFFILSSIWQV